MKTPSRNDNGRGRIRNPCNTVPCRFHQALYLEGHVKCPRCGSVLSANGPRKPRSVPESYPSRARTMAKEEEEEKIEVCEACNGRGRFVTLRDDITPPRKETRICEPCNGKGYRVESKDADGQVVTVH